MRILHRSRFKKRIQYRIACILKSRRCPKSIRKPCRSCIKPSGRALIRVSFLGCLFVPADLIHYRISRLRLAAFGSQPASVRVQQRCQSARIAHQSKQTVNSGFSVRKHHAGRMPILVYGLKALPYPVFLPVIPSCMIPFAGNQDNPH